MNGHTPKDNQLWEGTQSKSRIVRVIMPDGTSGVIVGERGQTLREGLKELCEQKNFPLQSIDVTVGYDKKVSIVHLSNIRLFQLFDWLETKTSRILLVYFEMSQLDVLLKSRLWKIHLHEPISLVDNLKQYIYFVSRHFLLKLRIYFRVFFFT